MPDSVCLLCVLGVTYRSHRVPEPVFALPAFGEVSIPFPPPTAFPFTLGPLHERRALFPFYSLCESLVSERVGYDGGSAIAQYGD